MKNKERYQLDIYGNFVKLSYISLCEKCDKKYKSKLKRGFNNVKIKKS